jgi:hypothetical protein
MLGSTTPPRDYPLRALCPVEVIPVGWQNNERERASSLRHNTQVEGLTLTLIGRNHDPEHALDCHRVAASTSTPISEESAGAMPFAAYQACCVCIVLSAESCLELAELNAFRFLCVLLSFGNLSDHA